MSDETMTEQAAEIEEQADTPATEYTPPEGWRVLVAGELLEPGDEWVNWEGTESRPDIQHGDGHVASGGRYIRPIKPEPVQVNDWPSSRDLRNELQSLQAQLAAVKAELATVAADRQRLQIELDAAQQVPADSPELRQLRADLEQMTLGRDTYRDGYERVLSDLKTIRETTKAETVETIAEWLQAFRGCNSPALALLLLEALPHIMRSLTGLEDEEIE